MTDTHPNLPAVPDDGDVEEMVFDGEVVEEDAPGASAPPPARAVIVQVFRPVTIVVTHPAPRATLRHASYVPRGAAALVKRRRQGRTIAQRMAIDLHQQGKSEQALLLLTHEADSRQSAHERWKGRVDMLVTLAAHWKPITVGTVGGMLAVGAAVHNPAAPFEAVAALTRDAWTVGTWAWRIGVYAGPAGLLAWLYRAGRREADWSARWGAVSADSDVDVAIDEAAITQALKALRIPQITDYLKTGQPMPYIVPCRQEGRGTYCEIRLPQGLPASEIAKPVRRERLAAGVYRHTKEVWPSVGGDANHLKLWIADKGALEGGAGPYPLLEEGFTDVFKGLPFGRTLRGDPSRIPVIGRNTICGGIPEQGKSNGARVVACGYTLDIGTEIRIYVPDTNFDFEHFQPRCARYVMGAEDEHIEAILSDMEELKDELQKRGQLLVDYEVQEVTREIARAGVGLHPVFVLLEEAHVAIQHKKHGKDISQLLCDIVKLDRKRGVHLFVSTQAPTKDSMPRDVTRNCANGIAFAVGDHVANDALLGQGAYRAGHRATELIPGTDRGTALCKGFSGERSEMVQAHRIQASSNADQVTPLVNRALRAMAAQGRAVPGTERGLLVAVERDLLADLATVLAHRTDKVRVADLPRLLHNLAPSWREYDGMTGVQLRERLLNEGVRTTNPGNVPTLDTDDLHRAIRAREDEVS